MSLSTRARPTSSAPPTPDPQLRQLDDEDVDDNLPELTEYSDSSEETYVRAHRGGGATVEDYQSSEHESEGEDDDSAWETEDDEPPSQMRQAGATPAGRHPQLYLFFNF